MGAPFFDGINAGRQALGDLLDREYRDRQSSFDNSYRSDVFGEDKRRYDMETAKEDGKIYLTSFTQNAAKMKELESEGKLDSPEYEAYARRVVDSINGAVGNDYLKQHIPGLLGGGRDLSPVDKEGGKPYQARLFKAPDGRYQVFFGNEDGDMLTEARDASEVVPGNKGTPLGFGSGNLLEISDALQTTVAADEVARIQGDRWYDGVEKTDLNQRNSYGGGLSLGGGRTAGSISGTSSGTSGAETGDSKQSKKPGLQDNFKGAYQTGNESPRVTGIPDPAAATRPPSGNLATDFKINEQFDELGVELKRTGDEMRRKISGSYFLNAAEKGATQVEQALALDPKRAMREARSYLQVLNEEKRSIEQKLKNGEITGSDSNAEFVLNRIKELRQRILDKTMPQRTGLPLNGRSTFYKPEETNTPEGAKEVAEESLETQKNRVYDPLSEQEYKLRRNNLKMFQRLGFKMDMGGAVDYLNTGDPAHLQREYYSNMAAARMAYNSGQMSAKQQKEYLSLAKQNLSEKHKFLDNISNAESELYSSGTMEYNKQVAERFRLMVTAEDYMELERNDVTASELAKMYIIYQKFARHIDRNITPSIDEMYLANKMVAYGWLNMDEMDDEDAAKKVHESIRGMHEKLRPLVVLNRGRLPESELYERVMQDALVISASKGIPKTTAFDEVVRDTLEVARMRGGLGGGQ